MCPRLTISLVLFPLVFAAVVSCDSGGGRTATATPTNGSVPTVQDLSRAIPSPDDINHPALVPAMDSGAFDAKYATHYTLDPTDTVEDLQRAGLRRGYAVTYYHLVEPDRQSRDVTILMYVAEFDSAASAADFVRQEAAFVRAGQPAVEQGTAAESVASLDANGLPENFRALYVDLITEDGEKYGAAIAIGSRAAFVEFVWVSRQDRGDARADIGAIASVLDKRTRELVTN